MAELDKAARLLENPSFKARILATLDPEALETQEEYNARIAKEQREREEKECRNAALSASAKSKLTEEEWDAVESSWDTYY